MAKVTKVSRLFANGITAVSRTERFHKASQVWTQIFDKDGKLMISRLKYLQPGRENFRRQTTAYPLTARASKILSKDSTQIFGNHILSTDEYFVRLKASAKKIRHDIAISTPLKPYSNWFSKESKRFYG